MADARSVCRERWRSGFTLTELVAVVGLVALLAAVSAPRWFGGRTFEERLFLEEVLAAVRYAQKVALATGCEVRITTTGGTYALSQRVGCETGAFGLPVAHPAGSGPGYTGSAPAGLAFASDVDPFAFDAVARARNADGDLTEVLIGVGARTIAVAGETGFIDAP